MGLTRRAGEIGVNGLKIGLPAEHHIGGVFALVETPVIHPTEVFDDGAILTGKPIQSLVDAAGLQAVGDLLCPTPVADVGESIVQHPIGNVPAFQLESQPVMTVEIDL